MEREKIRQRLAAISPGSKVHVKLEDGTDVAGTFDGVDGDLVQVEDEEINLDKVETVLMDVSSSGPE